jgi:hypothetical protein
MSGSAEFCERLSVVLQNLSVTKTGAAVIHELRIVEKELSSIEVKSIWQHICFSTIRILIKLYL